MWLTLLHDPWQIEIQGEDDSHVEVATKHIRNLFKLVSAKTMYGSTSIAIILDDSEGSRVALKASPNWWPEGHGAIVPNLLVDLMDDPGRFRNEPLLQMKYAEIEDEVHRALRSIRYSRGSYDFSIRFGCFHLRGLKGMVLGGEHPLSSFKNTIQGSASCVTRRW